MDKPEQNLPAKIIVSSNEVTILEPKDIPDKDLLLICRETKSEPHLLELFNRFETYARVQSIYVKLNRGGLK